MSIDEKYERLKTILKDMGSVIVALSGGVDSALLLRVAGDVLGDKCVAATAVANIYPAWELEEAGVLAKQAGVEYYRLSFDPIHEVNGFVNNPADRCYICKKAVFSKIVELAAEKGISHVLDGTNADDMGDYRPGLAAVRELGVESPLLMAGFTKSEIRQLSKTLGMDTYDKPAIACLATRIPYNEEITEEKLRMIDCAEQLIRSKGIRNVRVRCHGKLARIEVAEEDIMAVLNKELRTYIDKGLKDIGFQYASVDLAGYRMGSMNAEVKNG